jgi:hypothetical protein
MAGGADDFGGTSPPGGLPPPPPAAPPPGGGDPGAPGGGAGGGSSVPAGEGVGSFFEGALAGDFAEENESWSKVGGQIVVGFIPYVGQVADARDTLAAVDHIWDGKDGAWGDLALAGIGWIPVGGDIAKTVLRIGRKEAKLLKAGEQVLKHADDAARVGAKLAIKFEHGVGGRLEKAVAKIEPHHIGTGTDTTEAARNLARRLGKETDDAGHAIGNNLGGPGGATSGNIFPMNPTVNRGAFAQFEKLVAEQVKAGKEVLVEVVPRYQGNATRPFEIVYNVIIDGKTVTRTFPNP